MLGAREFFGLGEMLVLVLMLILVLRDCLMRFEVADMSGVRSRRVVAFILY